ncbi:hypothetical protein J5N97_027502 [Dioscorea zingiberensis]|uniref:RCC1-like domain-containing protein n=1 Tax=Dioscorea zingiberensis TaxID=325984 RepID=A0A9D5H7P5_9LILI|nr:hypothetical protein J5N97_027502 [Dioscorea zingiberensis]
MESLTSPSGSGKQTNPRKFSSSSAQKDLWVVSQEGSISELDSALSLLKKNGGNIDLRNPFGLSALHIATWRNHVPMVKRLLAAGADPNARDGESSWSSLHRALHFGHLAVASVLLQYGASLSLEDSKYRTPVDLLSGPVSQIIGSGLDSVATEVYSWGSGTNYQLGTGNAHVQKLPGKVDALHGSYIKIIAASKFHSVAVTAGGELYTWGFGRGGRLGHPEFDIHSGQAAVITPRKVTYCLGARRVRAVAAAKHHTVIATEHGDVFTWGSNREGQLGYTSVDTQPTPRRVSSLREKIVAVAAANKHTAAVAESGEVFTWGCNKEGQLGYGTSNSASNSTPRLVEYLKGKVLKGVSAAKYHTIVLGSDGEVFTWGHRLVTPKRVIIARSLKKCGNAPLKFHLMERLHVVSIAAGLVHSTALTEDGALFYWVSADPDLKCQQLYSMCGRNIVSLSAGKYWTSAVTATGDIYMWDGKKYRDEVPIATRLHGIKHATSVCVGETHLLVISSLYHPNYPPKARENDQKSKLKDDMLEELDEELMFDDVQTEISLPAAQISDSSDMSIPSLKSLCEKVAIEFLVEPRNAIQLLDIADTLEANELRKHCEEIAIRNLDYIFTVSTSAIMSAPTELLAKLEKSLDERSSEPWSHRRLPTPTATFPAIIDSEEENSDFGYPRPRVNHKKPILKNYEDLGTDCFLQKDRKADQAVSKQVRALRKKLQQIDMLEEKQLNGHHLDDQQVAKLETRTEIENALAELGIPPETETKMSLPALTDGKRNKKPELSRKQRRKNKLMAAQSEINSFDSHEVCVEQNSTKDLQDAKSLEISKEKKEVDIDTKNPSGITEDCPLHSPRCVSKSHNNNNNKASQSSSSKKKNKKGGLSMFLSGALDDPKHAPPPPTPKSEGPAWGGAKIAKSSSSLRDIQNEQSKTKEVINIRLNDRPEDSTGAVTAGQIRLSSFLPKTISAPIAVTSAQAVPTTEVEKNTPPWSSAGTSPVIGRPSLRNIQMQQEKKQLSISNSPKTRTSGFSISSQGSPSESGGAKDTIPNRWFKPETNAPSSIRSIQIEEKAMKDLKRFYSSVKVVKAEPKF